MSSAEDFNPVGRPESEPFIPDYMQPFIVQPDISAPFIFEELDEFPLDDSEYPCPDDEVWS